MVTAAAPGIWEIIVDGYQALSGTVAEGAGFGPMPPARIGRYVACLYVACFLPLALMASVNWLVDPFLLRWPRAADAPDPAFLSSDREVHYNLVAHSHPRALLLGNSQTQHGLVPSHWLVPGPVINAGIVSASLPEMQRVLAIAQAHGTVEHAILGLDITVTRRHHGPVPQANDARLVAPEGGLRLAVLPGFLSFDMLKASIAGLHQQWRRLHYFAPDGHALDKLYVDSTAGKTTLAAIAGNLVKYRLDQVQPPVDFGTEMRAIRDQACAGNTTLTVYLTPIHALFARYLFEIGHGPDRDMWKRSLVQIANERLNCNFVVWDFSNFNPVTTEPLPAANATNALAYSWDGIHFREALGDRILAVIGSGHSDRGFGVQLTLQNIDSALAVDRAAGASYAAASRDQPGSADLFRLAAARP